MSDIVVEDEVVLLDMVTVIHLDFLLDQLRFKSRLIGKEGVWRSSAPMLILVISKMWLFFY
jgi:hypothetical protein